MADERHQRLQPDAAVDQAGTEGVPQLVWGDASGFPSRPRSPAALTASSRPLRSRNNVGRRPCSRNKNSVGLPSRGWGSARGGPVGRSRRRPPARCRAPAAPCVRSSACPPALAARCRGGRSRAGSPVPGRAVRRCACRWRVAAAGRYARVRHRGWPRRSSARGRRPGVGARVSASVGRVALRSRRRYQRSDGQPHRRAMSSGSHAGSTTSWWSTTTPMVRGARISCPRHG